MKSRFLGMALLGIVLMSTFLMACKHKNSSTSAGVSHSGQSITTLKGAAQ